MKAHSLVGATVVTREPCPAHKRLMVSAMTIMYGDETNPGMVEMLGGIGNPLYLLSQATAKIVLSAYEELKDDVPTEVVVPVALEILAMLREIAENLDLFSCDLAVMSAAEQRVREKLLN